MQQEKYSRQIRLFGEATQKKIEDSHIHIVDDEEKIVRHITRLLLQMGANVCARPKVCSESPSWTFACNLSAEKECSKTEPNICYISTPTLSLSREHTLLRQDPQTECEEYTNILAGVAVQEYIKSLAGMDTLQKWALDTSVFEI
ncbi:hypothetical protein NEMIN01_0241 [Nematocida minor]|uniref:uncharacterized protein n=1 Tax=Nematocida minor TaxID=1912983 RepID=UPI00222015BF|nr:uncharacterized protein NEMIN01_0241 [Nematocida minor]KAI5188977.1 hypothetical protein NEMIN01_0241 [Nematocida minor]